MISNIRFSCLPILIAVLAESWKNLRALGTVRRYSSNRLHSQKPACPYRKEKDKTIIQYSLPLPPTKTLELMSNEQEGVVIWKESHTACHSQSDFHFTLRPSNDRMTGSVIIFSCHHKIRYRTGTMPKIINLQS